MRSNPLTKLRDRGRSEEGFTLIELLVVVVILGILIGIAIPVYLNYRKSANDKAAQSDVRAAISTLESCNSESGTYPATPTGGTVTPTMTPCSQTFVKSTDTTMKYFLGTDGTYLLSASSSGGTASLYYCYSSKTGGSVVKSTGSLPTQYVAACPA